MSLMDRANERLRSFRDHPDSIGYQLRLNLMTLLCELLEKRGWSQKDLAKSVGKHESYVSRVLNGDSNCTFDTAGRLLFALGVRDGDVELKRTGFHYTGSTDGEEGEEDKYTELTHEEGEQYTIAATEFTEASDWQ